MSKVEQVRISTEHGKVHLFPGRQFIKHGHVWKIIELTVFGVLCVMEDYNEGGLLDYKYVAQLIEDTDVYMDYGTNWFGT